MSSIESFKRYVVWGALGALIATACSKTDEPDSDESAGKGASSPSGGADAQAGKDPTGGSVQGGENTSGGVSGAKAGAAALAGQGGGGEGGDTPGTTLPDDDGFADGGPLVLQITAAQSPALPLQPMLWTVTVGNTSDAEVADVEVMLRVPTGMSFRPALVTPPASTCGNGTCTATEEAVWALGDIPAGGSQTIQLAPDVLSSVGEGDVLPVQVRVSAPSVDPFTATKKVPVAASVPVEVTLTASADPLLAGELVELAVDIGNWGETELFEGVIRLELPAALQVKERSDEGALEDGEGIVTWEVPSLPAGATVRRLVKAQLHAAAHGGYVMSPRVTFTYDDAGVVEVAQVPIAIAGEAPPLVVRVASANDPTTRLGTAHYEVTIANTSSHAVDGVSLFAHVAPELSLDAADDAEPNTDCGNGVCTEGELPAWLIGTLAPGASQTVTVNADVLSSAVADGSLITTPFVVRAHDVSTLRVLDTSTVLSARRAQLALGTAVAPVAPLQSYSYEVDLGNIGVGALQQTSVALELPPGVTVDSASDDGEIVDGVVTWTVGAVELGGHRHRTVTVTVAEDTPAGTLLSARATLGYVGGRERDAVAEHTVVVMAEPLPLSVSVSASLNPIVRGGSVVYETTIKNISAQAIDGVRLLLRVPDGLSFSDVSGADPDTDCGNGQCIVDEEPAWELGTLAAGATKVVSVSPSVSGSVSFPAGTLTPFRQRLTAVDLAGTISIQSTLATTD